MISPVENAELGSSVRSKINEVIDFVNAAEPTLDAVVITKPSRAELVAHIVANPVELGQVFSDGTNLYRVAPAGWPAEIPDMPGVIPLDKITPDHFSGARLVDAGPMIRAAVAYAALVAPATVVLDEGTYIVTTTEMRVAYQSLSGDPGVLAAANANTVLFLPAGVSLIGPSRESTTLDCSGMPLASQAGIGFWDYSNGEAKGFTLIGPSATATAAHGMLLSFLSSPALTHVNRNVTLRNLRIKNWGSYGFGHQYGNPENLTVDDIIIENVGADIIDHKVRFGPGDPFNAATGVIYSNIVGDRPARRILTSVSGMGIRGRAQLSNIHLTGIPAGCSGIQMTGGVHQQDETRPSAQRTTLTNFYIEGEDPAAPVRALDLFSAGPLVVSAGYIKNGYVFTQTETTTPYGFRDGPSVSDVIVDGCRGGTAFWSIASRSHFTNCRSLSEKAYFDSKRGNLVVGQTALVVPDGISVTPVVLKNGTVMSSGYTVAGDTVTLSVAALVTDKFIIVQPTARAMRIDGVSSSVTGGGSDEFHNADTGVFGTDAARESGTVNGWTDGRIVGPLDNLPSRSALVAANTAIPGLNLKGGQVAWAGGLSYMRMPTDHPLFGTDPIPDVPLLVWAGTRTPFHFGWVGDGTEADQKRGNIALTFEGDTVLNVPGNYLFTNSNPITDEYPTGDEGECNWWAVRRAWYIGRDNVRFFLGAGVNFTAVNNSNCHFVQVGQPMVAVRDSGGSGIGATDHVDCTNVHIVGSLPFIDMNGDNQTAATADDDHFALAWVQNGAVDVSVTGLDAVDGNYYGIGFEGDFEDRPFTNCRAAGNRLRNFPADGIDQKDFGSDSQGVIIEQNTIIDCAYGTGFSGGQSAIDVREGALVRNNTIIFTTGTDVNREAIRAQSGTPGLESATPSRVYDNEITGNGGVALVRGLRVIGGNVKSRGNIFRNVHTGIWVTSPRFSSSQDEVYNPTSRGVYLGADVGAGWQADDITITGLEAVNCPTGVDFDVCNTVTLDGANIIGGDIGWKIAATAAAIEITGGSNTATTEINRLGTGSLGIEGVTGFPTIARLTASIPVDATGVKTILVPHGLKFTPATADVQVTWQIGGVTGFTFDIPPGVASGAGLAPDATNVNVIAKIGTGTGTPGNTILARVTINSFQR